MASGNKGNQKKVIKTVPRGQRPVQTEKDKSGTTQEKGMLFERQHYMLIGFGFALIAIGLILMSGGQQPDPEVWDESIIYSLRRMVFAPAFIIAGLVMGVVAIFKR
jgi:hypothetical protein